MKLGEFSVALFFHQLFDLLIRSSKLPAALRKLMAQASTIADAGPTNRNQQAYDK
jgi:hypothetical protein